MFSNLANLFFDLGKIDDSIVNHKKALEIEPNNLNSISGMGLSLSEEMSSHESGTSINFLKSKLFCVCPDLYPSNSPIRLCCNKYK